MAFRSRRWTLNEGHPAECEAVVHTPTRSFTVTLRERLASLRSSAFLRSVGVLVGGTAAAQLVWALALPVITRLYSPTDFSVLAVFAGLLSMISVAACLRFDLAIPIPASDGDAANILSLALLCTLVVSAVVAICVVAFAAELSAAVGQPELQAYLWLLPLGVMLAGAYSAMQFWFVRKRDFRSIAQTRVAQAVAAAGTQIGSGSVGLAPLGLLLGQMLNSGAACLGLGYRLLATDTHHLRCVSWTRMRSLFTTYDRFPKYSTFEAVSNSAGMQLPVIMIAALAAGPEAGFLMLALSVIQAPMGLVGGAVAQVYMARAPEEHRSGRLGKFTAEVFGGLLQTGVGPLVFAGIVAPDCFALLFGENWRRAGVLVSWMTPWFVMQFISSPVSMALHVTNHQRTALVLQVSGLVVRVAFVYGASLALAGFTSEAYALSGFIIYTAYLIVVLRRVDSSLADVAVHLRSAVPVVTAWTVGAIGFQVALSAVLATLR